MKTPATETKDGVRARICIYCAHEETEFIDMTGATVAPGCDGDHTFSAWYTKVAPTATEAGVSERICVYCGRTQTGAIAPTGNNGGNNQQPTPPDNDPVCTEHSFGEWVTVTEPTTETEGLKKHTCTVCGEEETATIDKLQTEEKDNTVIITVAAVGGSAVALPTLGWLGWMLIKKKRLP